jgi:hypothetical protein
MQRHTKHMLSNETGAARMRRFPCMCKSCASNTTHSHGEPLPLTFPDTFRALLKPSCLRIDLCDDGSVARCRGSANSNGAGWRGV